MAKWALITGASGGIGQAIAKRLAADGYHLFLHYFRNIKAIERLLEELETEAIAVQADLSSERGVEDMLEALTAPVDVLVQNCGDSYFGLITDMDDDMVKSMVQLNVTSPFLLAKKLMPDMIRKRRGHIIMVTSIWGLTGASCEVLYSMVKGGQNTFVKALAKEVAPSGLYVNGVAPGAIETRMMDQFTKEELAEIEEEIPMGRLGAPEEVAEVVAFLLSEKASYINGQIISVNGAWYT